MSGSRERKRNTHSGEVDQPPVFAPNAAPGKETTTYRPPYQADNLNRRFFERLVRHTENFSRVTWLGRPIWQNILDLWVMQETIWEVQPELLIECGTHRGGSAYFYAHLFDLMQKGKVITIDIVDRHDFTHPRI